MRGSHIFCTSYILKASEVGNMVQLPDKETLLDAEDYPIIKDPPKQDKKESKPSKPSDDEKTPKKEPVDLKLKDLSNVKKDPGPPAGGQTPKKEPGDLKNRPGPPVQNQPDKKKKDNTPFAGERPLPQKEAEPPLEEPPSSDDHTPDIQPDELDALREKPFILRLEKSIFLGAVLFLAACVLIGFFFLKKEDNLEPLKAITAKASSLKKSSGSTLQDLKEQQEQLDKIKAVKADLQQTWNEIYGEENKLEQDLEALQKIAPVDVIWSGRKFYAKGLMKRGTEITYTDYSDPQNPQKKKARISFTVDHGKLFSPPEKVLISQSLPDDLRIKAVSGTGTDRIGPDGYLVKVTLQNVSAHITKTACLKRLEELKRLKPQMDKKYEAAAAKAERKIQAIQDGDL